MATDSPERPRLQARVVLRERTGLETVDLAFAFIRAHLGAYVRLLGCIVPPFLVAGALTTRERATPWTIGASLSLLAIGDAAFTVLAARLVFDADVRVRDALGELIRRLPALLWMRLMHATGIALGTLCAVIPGVFLATRWCFASEVLLLERASSWRALTRSQEIAVTDSGVALGVALGLPTVEAALGYAFGSAMHELFGGLMQAPALARWLTDSGEAVRYVGFALALPIVSTARLLLYLGVRARIEGWDVQAAAAGLAASTVSRKVAEAA